MEVKKNLKRSELKDAHEDSVLLSFQKYYATLSKSIEILAKPEPPDAIITINGVETWIEITDAFFSNELAESITSYASVDKKHKPVSKEDRFFIEPDQQFSDTLKSVILKKFQKQSIGRVYKQFGQGILLVGVITPFSSAEELVISEKKNLISAIKSEEQRFKHIYFYNVNDHVFSRLF